MKKIIALDIGDAWTGIAISDGSCMFAAPYETVASHTLETFLKSLFAKQEISTVVVGYPKTMRDTVSEQTKKVEQIKNDLEKIFADVSWILWDERLSSKHASQLKHAKTKAEKLKSHAIAAAYILEAYLTYRSSQT